MCGIVAIYGYHNAAEQVNQRELLRIRDHMTMRGPDGSGIWVSDNNNVGFGHRRLSIIDLSDDAAQPMQSANGKLTVTFNGEIYNYKALRLKLQEVGYVFRTNSDTEVLLYLYAHKGEAMVNDLRGMFAFSLWDDDKCAMMLVRDAYGIKPLYYSDNGKTLRVASQVKSLLAGGGIPTTTDSAGLVGFYLFGSVPEPFTTYKEIRSLPAGTILWVDRKGVRKPKTFFSIPDVFSSAEKDLDSSHRTLNDKDALSVVREELLDSVSHHLVGDVPVGAFLSAGIDSSSLVGLMRDAGQKDIKTVTLGFDEFSGSHYDESPLAEQLALHYGTKHTAGVVTEKEFYNDLPKILEMMDQPSIDGVNSWFASKLAKDIGLKVVISGLGGDELFGGYSSFVDIPRWVNRLSLLSSNPFLGSATQKVMTTCSDFIPKLNPKLAGIVKYGGSYSGNYFLRRGLFMPWELGNILDGDMVDDGLRRLGLLTHLHGFDSNWPKSAFGQVASFETINYMRNQLLRDTDWTSMAHSLEVRVPLVDTTLLQGIAPILLSLKNVDTNKTLLASSPIKPLPRNFIGRHKTGFSMPMDSWISRSEMLTELSLPSFISRPGVSWARKWAYYIANRYH